MTYHERLGRLHAAIAIHLRELGDRTPRGQGTVEYVGLILLIGLYPGYWFHRMSPVVADLVRNYREEKAAVVALETPAPPPADVASVSMPAGAGPRGR